MSVLEPRGNRAHPRVPLMTVILPAAFLVSGLPNLFGGPMPNQPPGQPGSARSAARPSSSPTAASPAGASLSAKADSKMLHALTVYRRNCQRCHGEDGSGAGSRARTPQIPDFSNESWQQTRSDAQLMVSILDGKGASMPAFADKLSKADVHALVAYVRALDPPDTSQAKAAESDFEKRFRQLQEELDELRRQFRQLTAPPKP